MIGLALFAGVVIVVAAIGLGIGILVAGRLGRWLDRHEEPDDR